MPRLSNLALLLVPMLLMGCRFEAAGSGTPTYGEATGSGVGSPTPYGNDDPGDDDLSIISVVPVDGASYLPAAFQIVATFSEPYLGSDGDITGRFGPTCDAGVVLRPQISDDRTQVTWAMSAEPGQSYCFDLTVLSNLNNPPNVASQWETAPCGVSFDSGRGTFFESIGGETSVVTGLNQALANYYFPTLFSFPGVERASTFPLTSSVAIGRLLQVYSDDGTNPTGAWSVDPIEGAADVLEDCTIDQEGDSEPWTVRCSADSLTMPINIDIGSVTSDGTVLDPGAEVRIRIVDAEITATVGDSGSFSSLSSFNLAGSISEEDLTAMFEPGDDGDLDAEIDRLNKDADTNNDGTLDGYSVVIGATPVWIPIMGCDSSLY